MKTIIKEIELKGFKTIVRIDEDRATITSFEEADEDGKIWRAEEVMIGKVAFEKDSEYGINWSAGGTQTLERVELHLALMKEAIKIVKKLSK